MFQEDKPENKNVESYASNPDEEAEDYAQENEDDCFGIDLEN